MILQTPINIEPMEHLITYGDGLLLLGSCFADEVGNICKGLGFNAMTNPFGVLFNPASLAQAVQRLRSAEPFTPSDVVEVGEGFFCTISHNTEFWRPSEDALLDTANQQLDKAAQHFRSSKWVIVSLGTSWAYRHKASGKIVANCHKMPQQQFEREFLTVEKTFECLSDMVSAHPEKRFIFTVSPLRHLKDGLHENQLSKSALLLAADAVVRRFGNASYFPAYEILMDELRDYRFYKEDMTHPTAQAVQHIWEKFATFAIDPSEKTAMKMAHELRQMLHHKPFFPESEAYRKFEATRNAKLAELRSQHPQVIIENLSL